MIHEELQKGLINVCLVSAVKTFENSLLPSFMVIHLKKSLSLAETHVSYIYTLRETPQRPKYYVTKLMICISHRICCNRYLWPSWQQIKQCPIWNPCEAPPLSASPTDHYRAYYMVHLQTVTHCQCVVLFQLLHIYLKISILLLKVNYNIYSYAKKSIMLYTLYTISYRDILLILHYPVP